MSRTLFHISLHVKVQFAQFPFNLKTPKGSQFHPGRCRFVCEGRFLSGDFLSGWTCREPRSGAWSPRLVACTLLLLQTSVAIGRFLIQGRFPGPPRNRTQKGSPLSLATTAPDTRPTVKSSDSVRPWPRASSLTCKCWVSIICVYTYPFPKPGFGGGGAICIYIYIYT